jgi:hypothetical protein
MSGVSCASAVKHAHTTSLDGANLVDITDTMAAGIATDPDVNAAVAREGPLTIVVMPVVNHLQAEVIPSGVAHAFTGRIRALLSQHARDRFTWIMNRDAFFDLRRREVEWKIDPGPSPDAIEPQYALTATFASLTHENRGGRDASYVCEFNLTRLQTGAILWSRSYDIKKKIVKDFLD